MSITAEDDRKNNQLKCYVITEKQLKIGIRAKTGNLLLCLIKTLAISSNGINSLVLYAYQACSHFTKFIASCLLYEHSVITNVFNFNNYRSYSENYTHIFTFSIRNQLFHSKNSVKLDL